MKKIVIITNGTLPVPATKGGAVETLLQTFIDINEIFNDFQLIVFTVSHNKAITFSKSYRNTKFVFIDTELVSFKLGRIFRFFINYLKPGTLKNQFIYEVTKFKELFGKTEITLIENNTSFLPYIRRITNKPLGLHLHNDYLNISNENFSKKTLNNTDFVIGVSEYIKNRVLQIAPKQCKVDFVYNGINLNLFDSKISPTNKLKFQEKYGIENNDFVILFTGRLQETKGIKLLMEAFIEISSTHNVKLLVVGSSGFQDSKKSSFIKELEIMSRCVPNKIIFTGYIEHSEVHLVYGLADFAVLPSLSEEAFGLTVIEALASGLPVIVSDAGGMAETINDQCGFVIKRDLNMKENLKSQMIKLIVDENLRKEMSVQAKIRAQKFSDSQYYLYFSSFLKSIA